MTNNRWESPIVSKVLMDPALIRRPVARGLREGLQAAL